MTLILLNICCGFNFILGSIFIFLCFTLIIIHYHKQKQRKVKTEPRIKLNHNIYMQNYLKTSYTRYYI